MPLVAINNGAGITPLSQNWTHQQLVSQAMILTGTLDNEDNIFITNVRNHVNMHIGHLVDMLNQQASPYYGVYATATEETTFHPSGINFITRVDGLYTGNTRTTPLNWHSIKRVNLAVNATGLGLATPVSNFGNLTNWDIARITQQSNNLNSQHSQTIAWCHHGNEILLYSGSQVQTRVATQTIVSPVYSTANYDFVIWGYRQPVLDNLIAVGGANTSWTANVDLPDKYIKLLVDMTCKSIIQQRNGHVPNELDASINSGLSMLSQNLQQAVALEQQSFNQRKTGQVQRVIGEL